MSPELDDVEIVTVVDPVSTVGIQVDPPAPLSVTARDAVIERTVSIEPVATVEVVVAPPTIYAVASAAVGPVGPPGLWTQMTQAQYDALPMKDPQTLYVIIG